MQAWYVVIVCMLGSIFLECHSAYKHIKKQHPMQTIGISKKASNNRGQQNSFMLRVGGIECELCAQAVITLLKKHQGEDIRYVSGIEHSSCLFSWCFPKKNFDIIALRQDIEHAGFEFISIKGTFYGKIAEQSNSLMLDDLDVSVMMPKDQKKYVFNKSTAFSGTIFFDVATEAYALAY
jgi:hypothetical protein